MSEAARLETTGIESEAVDADLSPVGHVVMLDYDDVDVALVDADLERLEGPSVAVESSPGSYHVYGLALRSWDDVVVALEESHASREYVREMTRRGVATLRSGPKRRPDGEIETLAPTPRAVTMTRLRPPVPVSRPHTARLRQMAEKRGPGAVARQLRTIETGAVDGVEPVGDQLPQTRYETRGGEE